MGDLELNTLKKLDKPLAMDSCNSLSIERQAINNNPIVSFKTTEQKSLSYKPVIGDFKQGALNNCWFCAIAKSKSLNLKGNNQIKKMISQPNNGVYTITFASGEQFKVSENELKDDKVRFRDGTVARGESIIFLANKFPFVKASIYPNKTYSTGDKNLKILEIAANKYSHKLAAEAEKKGEVSKSFASRVCLDSNMLSKKLLFGDISLYPTNCINLNNLKESDILEAISDSPSNIITNYTANIILAHSYSVKRIDKKHKMITLINPHDTKEKLLYLSFEEFYNKFASVGLNGNYKETMDSTNIIQNADNPDFIKQSIKLYEEQTMSNFSQLYASMIPAGLEEAGGKILKAKFIANLIEYASKGRGTHEGSLKGALYSIDSKEIFELVNKELKSIENSEYDSNGNNDSRIEKYIKEEFMFYNENNLLKHINQFK